jgi:toxin HigB-1
LIKSFKHKGLEKFYKKNDKSKINPKHAAKIGRILDRLDSSTSPNDMNLPGYKLHPMSGNEDGTWSVWVNGNWRITFMFENENAIVVDYRDYH